jgi:hypothetical protein
LVVFAFNGILLLASAFIEGKIAMALITDQQWAQVRDKLLGIRSGKDKGDIDSAASYAMDIAEQGKWIKTQPAGWDDLLGGTIDMILGFKGAKQQWLMIITGAAPQSLEYKGTFPKGSVKPRSVVQAVQIGESGRQTLIDWVVANIPSK